MGFMVVESLGFNATYFVDNLFPHRIFFFYLKLLSVPPYARMQES